MRFNALARATAVAAVAAGALIVMGCSSNHDAGMMSPSSTTGASAADAMFAQMMIPHHEQAVVMSDLAETRSTNPEILALAAEIKAAQQPEIEQMKGWLTEWGVPVMSGMDAMDEHGGHGMSGMLTDEQIDQLAAASGSEFDILFAEGMIEHHEGAIDMAEDVIDSKDPRVAALAQAIIQTQQAEIAQMQVILESIRTQPQAAGSSPSPAAAVEQDASASPSTVDLAEALDHMHAVTLVGGDLLVGTHYGIVEVDPTTGEVAPRGEAHDDFMGLASADDVLVASGHPGHGSSLPDPLGLLRSADGAQSWQPVSLTGEVDFHALAIDGDRIVGQSTSGELLYSVDTGQSWESIATANATSLAWFDDRVWIANGQRLSSWSESGETTESNLGPVVFLASAVDGSALWAVLVDGTIHRTTDAVEWSMVGSVPEATYLAATADTAYLVSPGRVYVVPAA